MPADTPVTIPVEPIVAIPVASLLHVPPVMASLNEVVESTHNIEVPVIVPVAGKGLTVTTFVEITEPQTLVMV